MCTKILFAALLLTCTHHAYTYQLSNPRKINTKCQPLEIPACQKLGYNNTRIPPDMYLSMRMSEVKNYISLMDKTNCSKYLLFFLCTMYSPVCFEGYVDRILPCRSVCQDVYDGCYEIIRVLSIEWPSELQCKKLPEYNTGVCIQPSAIVAEGNKKSRKSATDRKTSSCPPCDFVPKLKRYKQFKRASYVIEAEVLSRVTTADGETKLRVFVHNVLKSGKVPVREGVTELWSDTICTCAPADFERRYYILGKEDKRGKRLLYDARTVISEQTNYWKEKMKKWMRQYQRLLQRRKNSDKKAKANRRDKSIAS